MSSVVDEFGLFEMPYLVKNRLHMRAIRDRLFWSKLAPAVEKQGYQIIAVWENGFRNITNNERPINVPADLQGIKLRTPKGAWRVKMFKSYGANPTPMALSEVFVALQTGVIDGQENPMAQIYSQKFQEVQKYLSLTGHVYTPAYVTVSKKHWAKLPADVRTKIEAIARGMQEFVYMKAAQLDDELLKKVQDAVEINTADKNAFIEASGELKTAETPQLSVNSSYFLLTTQVQIDSGHAYLNSVLYRQAGTIQVLTRSRDHYSIFR